MRRLVALDIGGGPAFTEVVRRCWDRGDCVMVVDQRLPSAARASLLAATRPHTLIGADDEVPVDPRAPDMDPGDALVVATSGSTGEPKAVVHTEASLLAHAQAVHDRLEVDPKTDRWLACLPLSHLGGFGVVARSILTGTPVDVDERFDAAAVSGAAETRGTTLVSVVATALDRIDPAPFRWVVVGGSADRAQRPFNVVRTYGLTESGGGVVYDGRPLPGVEVRVDEHGSISLRSATIGRGVRDRSGAVRPLTDVDGWLTTGDLGKWVDGLLVVEGRADDLIITGGENVWPAPVEAVLATHPGVADVAVIGESDPEWGQRVVAVVVPVDPAAPPSLDELRGLAKTTLPAPAAPRSLRLVPAIARTSLGKVQRGSLNTGG